MDAEAMLAQDLCARLCHDLVGPLGTVAGAIDLLAEEPEAGELARDAAAELRRRLKFWRAACGAGTGPLALSEVAGLVDGLLAGGRARLDLGQLPAEAALPAPVAQLLLVAAMLGGEALPRGGTVQVGAAPGGWEAGLRLCPAGRQARWPASLAPVLQGEGQGGPREVLARMLRRLAAAAGWSVQLAAPADAVGDDAAPALLLWPQGVAS
ncbi:histidine phosphotransferase family protein [Roseomonas sp. USHLN139]|uniref:histidine phosphotransferase family protein n=1 Tax=Roseomonas sp. USHLN139 TaxID=3081298 RepID=UPI003B020098